jgi:16S rRNA U516 pseudouridylate synthase RsuA-like enzyme
MCDAIERPVRKLVRIRIGRYTLGELPVGGFVTLNRADLGRLLDAGPRNTPLPR